MSAHLDALAVEALAHGRGDLVPDEERLHAQRCAECAAEISAARAEAGELRGLFREAMPEAIDHDALVAAALRAQPEVATASRLGLFVGAVLGLGALAGVAVASLTELPSFGELLASIRDAVAVSRAVDQLVTALPGGWATLALAGCAVLLVLSVPLRSLASGRRLFGGRLAGSALALVGLLALAGAPATASALELEGEWPADERVTVSVRDVPRSEVLRRAAATRGLDFIASLDDDPLVSMHLQNVTLREVVVTTLGEDAPYVVSRTDALVSVRPARITAPSGAVSPADPATSDPATSPPSTGPPTSTPAAPPAPPVPPALSVAAPAPPAPPVPPVPPVPAREARDRVTFGGDVEVGEGEVVRSVVTMGGDASVRGTVLNDVVTMGGDIRVRETGVVHGQLVTMGGEVTVDDGGFAPNRTVAAPSADVADPPARAGALRRKGARVKEMLEGALGRVARHALLFLLGLILLGATPERLAALQRTIVRRPIRSGATGILAFVLTPILCVVLAITVIGIPAALIVALFAFLAIYVGLAASASVLGATLPFQRLHGRPVLQLFAGVALLFGMSLVPFVGPFAVVVAAALGFGAVIATRFRKTSPVD